MDAYRAAVQKLKIGSSRLRISPRSIAIPTASDATLFETDFMSCSVSASKPTFSTRRHVGSACHEPFGHPAQRSAVDELVLIDGGDGPAVVARGRNAAAVGQIRDHRQRGERCQRSSTEK
jgi:hypothetical protein